MHHGRFSNKHIELVYTKYELNRSIIKEDGCIQPFRAQNPVFDTLTLATYSLAKKKPEVISFIIRGEQFTSILRFGFFRRRAQILHSVPIVTHVHELQRGPYVKSIISSEFTRTSKLK